MLCGSYALQPKHKSSTKKERRLGLGVGLFAGVIGTMTTVNGPFFIMYLLGLKIDRREILAALGLLFVVSGACFLIFLVYSESSLSNALSTRDCLLHFRYNWDVGG